MKETLSKVGLFSVNAENFSTTYCQKISNTWYRSLHYLSLFQMLFLTRILIKILICFDRKMYSLLHVLGTLMINVCLIFFTVRILVKEANDIGNYLTIQIRIPVGKATVHIVKIRGQLIIGLFFPKPHVDFYNSLE